MLKPGREPLAATQRFVSAASTRAASRTYSAVLLVTRRARRRSVAAALLRAFLHCLRGLVDLLVGALLGPLAFLQLLLLDRRAGRCSAGGLDAASGKEGASCEHRDLTHTGHRGSHSASLRPACARRPRRRRTCRSASARSAS